MPSNWPAVRRLIAYVLHARDAIDGNPDAVPQWWYATEWHRAVDEALRETVEHPRIGALVDRMRPEFNAMMEAVKCGETPWTCEATHRLNAICCDLDAMTKPMPQPTTPTIGQQLDQIRMEQERYQREEDEQRKIHGEAESAIASLKEFLFGWSNACSEVARESCVSMAARVVRYVEGWEAKLPIPDLDEFTLRLCAVGAALRTIGEAEFIESISGSGPKFERARSLVRDAIHAKPESVRKQLEELFAPEQWKNRPIVRDVLTFHLLYEDGVLGKLSAARRDTSTTPSAAPPSEAKPSGDDTGGERGEVDGKTANKEPIEAEFIFRPDGDGYFLKGFSEQGRVTAKGAKGLHDLFRLVQTPGIPVPMLELDAGAGTERAEGDGRSIQPVVDPQGMRRIAEEVRRLRADINSIDPASPDSNMEREELEKKLAELMAEATKVRGKNGKVRDLNASDLNRMKSNIWGRINTVCNQIESLLPKLSRHFRDTTGAVEGVFYGYKPGIPDLKWDTDAKMVGRHPTK